MRPKTITNAGLTVLAGQPYHVFGMGFPPTAIIKRIRATQQKNGTPVSATIDFFNAAHAAPQGTSSSNANTDSDLSDKEVCRVCPTLTVPVGGAGEYVADGAGIPYANQDSTVALPVYKMWVVITPSVSAADSIWDIAVDCLLQGNGGSN